MPYYVFHYTYGIEYTLHGRPQGQLRRPVGLASRLGLYGGDDDIFGDAVRQ